MKPIYTISELARLAGVSVRTIRFYVRSALLQAPGVVGRGPGYHDGHLARLRLIRRLQSEHLPLSVIRLRLESLQDADLIAMPLADAHGEPPDRVAEDGLVYGAQAGGRPARSGARVRRTGGQRGGAAPVASTREQWEHVALTADLELHVRRPQSREMNRRIARIIAAASAILAEDGS